MSTEILQLEFIARAYLWALFSCNKIIRVARNLFAKSQAARRGCEPIRTGSRSVIYITSSTNASVRRYYDAPGKKEKIKIIKKQTLTT